MARKSRKAAPVPTAPVPTAPVAPKVWRAALYIRLSVEFNGKRGDSLETQREIMEAYLSLCPDIEIAGVYTDNGVTGRTFEREAFQRMLADLEAGQDDCVVVKDLSRLGRSAIDAGFYVEKYFPLHHIRFIAVNDQYDSEENDNSGSHIIVPLKNMMNEAYAADISRKVRAQQHQAMKEGAFVGGRPPYGYKKAPDNCHRLLVNEDTAPVVRQIFQWAAEGVALNRIVLRLNESGVLCPRLYQIQAGLLSGQTQAGSGQWQTWTVAEILADAVYTGDMAQGKTKIVGGRRVFTAPEEWIVVRDTHEPIVSRELFARAQAARRERSVKYTASARIPYTENLLCGRVFCGHCGRPLNRHRRKKRYVYHCVTNEKVAPGACKGGILTISESKLFETILTIIRREAETVAGNSLRLKQRDAKLAAKEAEAGREIEKLRRETEKNRAYRAGLYQNFSDGVLTQAEYMELKEGYNRKIHEAAERVRQLLERQNSLKRRVTQYFTLAERLAAVDGDTVLTAALVDQVIERVTVNGPEDISVQFRFVDEFEELMEALDDV